ncbi:MAG: glycoside hydrolase family 99-like domain-containing protein [Bacteroidia bacterium]|nr:glycoside hydrolase family 99-like domain-containing protein [Bacteroidia bacterium]
MKKRLRAIAFYLPQFHPIPENDTWWGKGFTEWRNVVKARPLFKTHYQPHIPKDLGFYDLRLEESRLSQETLAKQYGIYGFCYYHYWFNGKRLLYEPLQRKLKNQKEDMPFMICWANENWTRRWDGLEQEILIKQVYSENDDREHIRFLCKHYFSDERYIKIYGKPFIAIYRPSLLPNISNTIQLWRKEAIKCGIGDIYVGLVNSFGHNYSARDYGADASIQFAPHLQHPKRYFNNVFSKFLFQIYNGKESLCIKTLQFILSHFKFYYKNPYIQNRIYDYHELVMSQINKPIEIQTFPCIFPMWDNTARKKGKNALIYINSTPKKYAEWLENIANKFIPWSDEENFIFINAWNEWAEGNHLEPCEKWDKAYLEATYQVLSKYS